MSSYVDSVLAPGERVAYRAHISHWKFFGSYLAAAIFLLAFLCALVFSGDRSLGMMILIALPLLIALGLILSALIQRSTTELVLTDRRIITKRGLVSRNTVEMNLGKVESLHVDQGLMGRMFNYGDVTVVGTGSSLEPLRGISSPLELRKRLGSVAEVVAPAKAATA